MKLLDYLREHKKDDAKAYTIGGMLGALVFLILSVFSLSIIDHYLLRSGSLAAVISAVLVDLTNSDRSTSSLGGLTINPVLTAAAQAKADDMAARGYFAHVSPEGKDSWYWFRQAGYRFLYAGENLAVDFSDSIDVERAWMNSPLHRQNILNGNFTQIGIATAEGVFEGHSTTFVVQMFGAPAKVIAPVRVLAEPAEPTAPALATTVAPKSASTPASTTVEGVATTAPAVTAPVEEVVLGVEADSITTPSASWWELLLASPKSVLRYAYYALAGMILILLAYATEFEFHRRHLRHVADAALLFVLMFALFILADLAFFAKPIIAALAS
jgi:hypothetical protein